MTITLEPAGGLFAVVSIAPPSVALVRRPWEPNAEPVPIPPGALDGVETLRRRIYWQWQQDPSWLSQDGGATPGIAEIIGFGLDALTAEHYQIDQFRWLATGSGEVLDEWGALVDLPRNGLIDTVYRRAIYARGAATIGDAGIDAVLRPIKQLLGEDSVTYAPAYPRGFCWIVTVAVTADLLDLVVSLVSDVPGAGIAAKILLSPPESPGWDWSTPQAWAASWSSAYGPVDASVASPWGWSVLVG